MSGTPEGGRYQESGGIGEQSINYLQSKIQSYRFR